MRIFLDTADTTLIEKYFLSGLVDGVTTNPSLIYKSGQDFKKVIKEISSIIEGPISAEVTSKDSGEMIAQGKELAKIAKNIVVKVPLTKDGLIACKLLSSNNIKEVLN